MPINAWPVRWQTNASLDPSGDQCKERQEPRRCRSCCALGSPDKGAHQMGPALINATRSFFGAMRGEWPPPSNRDFPDSTATTYTVCSGTGGLLMGLGSAPP